MTNWYRYHKFIREHAKSNNWITQTLDCVKQKAVTTIKTRTMPKHIPLITAAQLSKLAKQTHSQQETTYQSLHESIIKEIPIRTHRTPHMQKILKDQDCLPTQSERKASCCTDNGHDCRWKPMITRYVWRLINKTIFQVISTPDAKLNSMQSCYCCRFIYSQLYPAMDQTLQMICFVFV